MSFWDLTADDKDLTMFSITNLTLVKNENRNMVSMTIKLKRKVVTELVTTYLPTILLLLITFTTIFFDKDLFGDAIAVNLTIMLVMTTIFTSKIEELPPTSDLKMLDYWLIFCLIVPFLEVILRTAIECLTCGCQTCEPEQRTDKTQSTEKEDKAKEGAPSGQVARVWAGTDARVAPQQVRHLIAPFGQNKFTSGTLPAPRYRELDNGEGGKDEGGCWTKMLQRNLE